MWRADEDILKNILTGKVNKKHPYERPRTIWKDTVENDMRLVDGSATLDWTLVRAKWRGLLHVAAQKKKKKI